MAKAIKCDRCGTYFDEPSACDIKRVYLVKGTPNYKGFAEVRKDLCNQCYNVMELFINDPSVLFYSKENSP